MIGLIEQTVNCFQTSYILVEALEIHQQKLEQFSTKYKNHIEEIEEALDEFLIGIWDRDIEPAFFDLTSQEQFPLIDHFVSDNKILSKVLLVFAALCLEVQTLKEAVTLYTKFVFFFNPTLQQC
jgi:WASH complex subunit 7